jgi:hypothetical protein
LGAFVTSAASIRRLGDERRQGRTIDDLRLDQPLGQRLQRGAPGRERLADTDVRLLEERLDPGVDGLGRVS